MDGVFVEDEGRELRGAIEEGTLSWKLQRDKIIPGPDRVLEK